MERIRRQIVAGLESGKDNPRRLAGRAWYRLVFGDHPYARPLAGTPQSVAAVTVEDLRRFVRERLVREGLVVEGSRATSRPPNSACGSTRRSARCPHPARPARSPEAVPKGGALKVIQKQIPQSVVVFGQAGLRRDDPDFYAAYVMNHILAVGRSSRLNREIREKRGLVYSVSSHLAPFEKAGLIVGGLATANARVGTALDLLREEWGRMARDGVSEAELVAAKRFLNGAFPLRLDSTGSIARMLVGLQENRLGIDYVDRRSSLIGAVTAGDVQRVARRLLSPDKLTIVVAGSPEGLDAGR